MQEYVETSCPYCSKTNEYDGLIMDDGPVVSVSTCKHCKGVMIISKKGTEVWSRIVTLHEFICCIESKNFIEAIVNAHPDMREG